MRYLRLLLLLVSVNHLGAGVPEVLAYRKISSPYHEVPNLVGGSSIYSGRLLITNKYLIVYEPQILDAQNNIKSWGYIEIFDRLTFIKLGEIHPKETMDNKRWGTSLAISEDYLAVGSSGIVKTLGVDVYNLETFRRLYQLKTPKETLSNEFGGLFEAVSNRLIVHGSDTISIYDLTNGKLLGTPQLAISRSRSSGNSRFLMYSDPPDEWGYSEPTHVVDLQRPDELLRIRNLPFLQADYSKLYAKRSGSRLCLIEPIIDAKMIHGYDLQARKHLFSIKDEEDDCYGAASWKERLFVPDSGQPNGRVVVRDMNTGKVTGIIALKAESTDKRFGHRLACLHDTLFISSEKAWYAYNPKTLKLLYRIDNLGWRLEDAEPVPIKGSNRIGFVFNFPNYKFGPLYNSFYYNPQVMLLDPVGQKFTHRLNLAEGIIMSGSSEPRNFGRKLYASGPDAVAVNRPGHGGEYKLFSLSPSVGEIRQNRVASVSYASKLGYSFEVRKIATNEAVQKVAFGTGYPAEVDIPYSAFSTGERYELVRNQQFRVKDDYEVLWQDLTLLLGSRAYTVAVHGELAVVSVPEFSGLRPFSGAIFIVNLTQKKIVRVIQSPNPKRAANFGSHLDLDGNVLAVALGNGTYAYNLETGDLIGKFPRALTVAVSGNILEAVLKISSTFQTASAAPSFATENQRFQSLIDGLEG